MRKSALKNKTEPPHYTGEKHWNWKGKNVGRCQIHQWLYKHFGNANKCENRENQILDFVCNKKSNNYNWALKKEHNYSRNRDDYYQLCISCHRKYDYKEIYRVMVSKRLKGKKLTPEHRAKVIKNLIYGKNNVVGRVINI